MLKNNYPDHMGLNRRCCHSGICLGASILITPHSSGDFDS